MVLAQPAGLHDLRTFGEVGQRLGRTRGVDLREAHLPRQIESLEAERFELLCHDVRRAVLGKAQFRIGVEVAPLRAQEGLEQALAGLWEYWRPADGDPVVSMTIINTDAVGPLTGIHDRMPLILPASEWAAWLDPRIDPGDMLAPPAEQLVAALELRPVGAAVGNVANDNPGLIDLVAVEAEWQEAPTLI